MSMLKKAKNWNEQGMTLLEVLAALVLLLILSTTVVAVFTPASLWIQQARNETTASNYARAVLENLRADRAGSTKIIATNNGKSADDLWPGHSYKPSTLPMTATLTIEERSESSNLFNITVTVKWTESSTDRTKQMFTVMRAK